MRRDGVGGRVLGLLGTVLMVGCGSGETVVQVTPPPAVEQLRMTLNEIGEAGVVDSSVAYVQQLAEEITTSDPTKAGLVEAAEKLARSRGKSAVRKQVDELLAMLEAAP